MLVAKARRRLARRRRNGGPKLTTCACGSGAVSALHRGGVDATLAHIRIRCGECARSRELAVTVWSLDLYQRDIRREVEQMAAELARLERARMAVDVESFITALRHDLLAPADFSRRRCERSTPRR